MPGKRTTLADLFVSDHMIEARCVICGYSAPIRPEWFWIQNRNFPKHSPVGEAMKCIRCTPCSPRQTPIAWKVVPRIHADRREPRKKETHQIEWWRE